MATGENPDNGEISDDKKLKKVLTSWDLYFLSLGAIIGSGWLFAESASAGTTGPAAIISWIIGGAIVLVIIAAGPVVPAEADSAKSHPDPIIAPKLRK